jgi:hypothetical protein
MVASAPLASVHHPSAESFPARLSPMLYTGTRAGGGEVRSTASFHQTRELDPKHPMLPVGSPKWDGGSAASAMPSPAQPSDPPPAGLRHQLHGSRRSGHHTSLTQRRGKHGKLCRAVPNKTGGVTLHTPGRTQDGKRRTSIAGFRHPSFCGPRVLNKHL